MMKNLSAVLIAGRTGRHLKTPVPLLPFGDTTILNRTLNAYLDAGFSEVIIGLSYRAGEVQASLGPLADKVQLVISADPDEELGGLIRRSCEHLSPAAKAFAIGMGDQPLLDKELLSKLADRFSSSKARILVPVCQGTLGYPVFFEASLLAEIKRLGPHEELWDLLKAKGSEVFDYALYHTSVIRHVDDIEDYHQMLRIAGLPIPETSPLIGSSNGGSPDAGRGAEPEAAPGESNPA